MNREKTIIRTSIIGIIANAILVFFKATIGLIVGSIAIINDVKKMVIYIDLLLLLMRLVNLITIAIIKEVIIIGIIGKISKIPIIYT